MCLRSLCLCLRLARSAKPGPGTRHHCATPSATCAAHPRIAGGAPTRRSPPSLTLKVAMSRLTSSKPFWASSPPFRRMTSFTSGATKRTKAAGRTTRPS